MKKVIVTGSNSFVGEAIVRQLSIYGYKVFAMARRFPDDFPSDSNIERIVIDSYNDYVTNIPNADVLIHCAWMGTTQDTRVNEDIHKENYEVSMKMIQKATQDKGIKKIILAGSQAEYGPTNGKINENSPINPNTAYGKYKNKLFEDAKHTFIDFVIIDARIFSTYGPKQDDRNMIPSILKNMICGEDCLFTPATQLWNYIYVDDCARFFAELVDDRFSDSFCLNLASNDTRQLKLFIKDMVKETNSTSKIIFGAKEYNSSGYVSLDPDISKLVNYFPNFMFTDFKVGIDNTIAWIRKELKK